MKTLLVPIDFSPITRDVVETAAGLSRGKPARIVLVHVIRPPVPMAEYGAVLEASAATVTASEATAGRLLDQWEKVLRRRKLRVRRVKLNGFPSAEILRQAKKEKASMIVMGSHGHTAFYDLLIGATASGVLRKASCPVVIVPASAKSGRAKR